MNQDLQARATQAVDDIERDVKELGDAGLVVVKAPPGAGKTHLLLHLLSTLHDRRVAVACFTNAQADDICRRGAVEHPTVTMIRYVSATARHATDAVPVVRSAKDLPDGPCAVVANVSKWGASENPEFEFLLVDEAWQVSWADLSLLRYLAPRIVLIGDPGQIPPVVSIPTNRWETAPAAPHWPAPERLLAGPHARTPRELPATRRLPADTAALVRHFYDFDFGAMADPGDRFVRFDGTQGPVDAALRRLGDSSISTLLIPTDDAGPPAEVDQHIADAIAGAIVSLLKHGATYSDSAATRKNPVLLEPSDIGVVASHRSMNTMIHGRLPARIRPLVKVDTTERWQGLECKVMFAVHPLSGTTSPSSFDLETGRLCVMASRHQSGLVIVTRDHVGDTLDGHIPDASQPLGRPDINGRGLARHRAFWRGVAA